jgi:hypothetical protein
MKLPKEKKDRLTLVVVCGFAICVGIWFGLIQTRRTALNLTQTKLTRARNLLDQENTWLKKADSIETEMERTLKVVQEIEANMASANDPFAWSYVFLDKARSGHDNIEIREVLRPEKKESDRKKEVGIFADFPYNAVVFTVSGAAYYHEFGDFIADFENRFPYFRIQNISLSNPSEPGAGAEGSTRLAKEKLLFRMDVVALIKPT